MLRTVIVTILLFITMPASAKLYKCPDADGNISYTDEPCVGGKELKLPPLPTFKAPPVKPGQPEKASATGKTAMYSQLEILKPKNDATMQNSTGKVEIILDLTPALQGGEGHRITLSLDGKKLEGEGQTTRILLDQVDPGTHSLQVSVVDKKGEALITSKAVTFHIDKKTVYDPNTVGGQRAIGSTPAQRAPGL
jgi:hypothetical protein